MNHWLRQACREVLAAPGCVNEAELALAAALLMATHAEPDELRILLADLLPRVRSQDAA